MNDFHRSIFISEIERQCKFAIYSFEDIRHYLQLLPNRDADINRVWLSIQSFLGSVRNISKLLWSKKDNPRGQELRDLLKINEDSLLKIRDFRNHFEHFDERLERWALPLNNYVDANIGPPGMIVIDGMDESQFLRSFDPSTFTLRFRDDSYDVYPVAQEVVRLLETISIWEKNRWR